MTKPETPKARKEKKSEMLDVRLPYGMKRALVAACKQQGVTVSDTVRGLISEYIAATEADVSNPKLKGIAMKILQNPRKTFGMTLVSAFAATLFLTSPSVADDKIFESFDTDNNGRLSESEVSADVLDILDLDKNEEILPDEFQTYAKVFKSEDRVTTGQDGKAVREVSYVIKELRFEEPYSTSLNVNACSDTLPIEADKKEVEAVLAQMKRDCSDHN